MDGDRVLLVPLGDELLEAPARGPVAQYAVIVIVEAGEDGGPGGATNWVTDKGLFEGEALLGHQGGYLGHLLSGGIVQVVGEDKEDVGPVGGSRLSLFFLRRIGGRGLRSRTACTQEEKDHETPHYYRKECPSDCTERSAAVAYYQGATILLGWLFFEAEGLGARHPSLKHPQSEFPSD